MSDAYYQPPEPDPGIEWARDQIINGDDLPERATNYILNRASLPESMLDQAITEYLQSAQIDADALDLLADHLDDIA